VGLLYIGLGLLDHRQYALRATGGHGADGAVNEIAAEEGAGEERRQPKRPVM